MPDNNTLRLFIGSALSPHFHSRIDLLVDANKHMEGVKWIPKPNRHLTVLFLGNVPIEIVDNISALIKLSLKNVNPFSLQSERYALAPKAKSPRMIWLKLAKHDLFRDLVQTLSRQYAIVKPDQQQRTSPIPHITLARFKGFKDFNKLELDLPIPNQRLEIKELTLWASDLHSKGARYKVIQRFPFTRK